MSAITELLPILLRGLRFTLELTIVSAVLALILAFAAGLGRISKIWVIRTISAIYVEIFRGTSLLVQLFWIFFVLPLLGLRLEPFLAGVIGLGCNLGAYGAEVVRGAILAFPQPQIEAGIALNMTPFQRMVRIIIPQAWVRILPPFGNLLIELIKSTALASLITIPELTYQGYSLRMTTGRTQEVFTLLLVIYFLVAYPFTRATRWLESRRRWA